MPVRAGAYQCVGLVGLGEEQRRDFSPRLDCACPTIDASARLEDVHASCESVLDHRPADGLCLGKVGEDRVDRHDAHFPRPMTWIPQAVAMTTSAPTA